MACGAEPVVFAGPSAVGLPRALQTGVGWRPPARRGDIERLLDEQPAPRAGVLVLADGFFGFEPAVGHAELCRAIDAGWQVWGCSSMGAIRAWELRHEGMRGFGWVYEQFARHDDFTDDELALLHLPVAPWEAFSLPLVNLRHALAVRGAALGIAPRAQQRLVGWLRGCWFGERTPELVLDLMTGPLGLPAAAAAGLLDQALQHPVKNHDLRELLRRQPWRLAADRAR